MINGRHAFSIFSKIAFLSLTATFQTVYGQAGDAPSVNWLELDSIRAWRESKPRPVFIYMYVNGNDSSELMFNTTFKSREVCDYLNNKFYPVKIDMTTAKSVRFLNEQVYVKKQGQKFNGIANYLLGDKPHAPSVVVYTRETNGFQYPGYKDDYDLMALLIYFFEDVDKTTKLEEWLPAYEKAYPSGQTQHTIIMPIRWMPLEAAIARNKIEPKGIFLNWYTKWSVSSNVMLSHTFGDPEVAEYMNKNFYCVRIDAQTDDTLTWKGQVFVNDNQAFHFHQMALSMLKGKMRFPSLIFFGNDDKLAEKESIFLPPSSFLILAQYVKSGSYKEMPFKNYLKAQEKKE